MMRAGALAATAALVAVLAGCGGSGSSTTTASSSTTVASAATTTTGAQASSNSSSVSITLSSHTSATDADATTTLLIDSICEAFQTKVSKVKPPSFNAAATTVKQLPIVAAYLGKVATLNQSESKQLAAAAKTANQPTRYQAFVQGFEQLTMLEQTAQQDAKRGDLSAFTAGLTGAGTAEQAEAARAKTLGLKACG